MYSEIIYFIAITFMSLGIALISLSELGLSMVVAPAYIISEKIDGLTFGRAEYMVQGMVFCVFCIIKKKIKPVYFFSFFTGVLYGILIDFWRSLWGKYMTIIIQSGKLVGAHPVSPCFAGNSPISLRSSSPLLTARAAIIL